MRNSTFCALSSNFKRDQKGNGVFPIKQSDRNMVKNQQHFVFIYIVSQWAMESDLIITHPQGHGKQDEVSIWYLTIIPFTQNCPSYLTTAANAVPRLLLYSNLLLYQQRRDISLRTWGSVATFPDEIKPKLHAGLRPANSSDVCLRALQAKVKKSNGLFSAVSCWEQWPCPPVCHKHISIWPALFTP